MIGALYRQDNFRVRTVVEMMGPSTPCVSSVLVISKRLLVVIQMTTAPTPAIRMSAIPSICLPDAVVMGASCHSTDGYFVLRGKFEDGLHVVAAVEEALRKPEQWTMRRHKEKQSARSGNHGAKSIPIEA